MLLRFARAMFLVYLATAFGVAPTIALADEPAERPASKAEVRNGFTPLHFAAMQGKVDEVAKLLDAGIDANARHADFKGTPLQYAAAGGHLEIVKLLLRHEATVDAVDANGRTPLMWAAMHDRASVVQALLDADANIGAANEGGWTALHYAMSYDHKATSELLLNCGASKELLNKQGKTPLDVKGTNVEPAADKKGE